MSKKPKKGAGEKFKPVAKVTKIEDQLIELNMKKKYLESVFSKLITLLLL